MNKARDIIIRPIITEKSMKIMDAENKITFEVAKGSNKTEIEKMIEDYSNLLFNETLDEPVVEWLYKKHGINKKTIKDCGINK